ncbi:MAG: nucleotidyltransferase [Bacteroidota bacterium]
MLSPDFKEFIELLNKNRIEYLVVGGYAVGIYGYPRFTGDFDVWVNNDENTAHKLIITLEEFGFASLGLSESDFLEENSVIQLGHPPFRIDILNSLDGVFFEKCYSRKNVVEINEIKVNFIDLDDLKTNKRSTGRNRDKDDLENLP